MIARAFYDACFVFGESKIALRLKPALPSWRPPAHCLRGKPAENAGLPGDGSPLDGIGILDKIVFIR